MRARERSRIAGLLAAGVALTGALTAGLLTGPALAEPSEQPDPTDRQVATGLLVPGTPCTSSARACVDLASRSSWLFEAGRVVAGPVTMRPGDPEAPTPTGTFAVQWKAEQWTSRERLTQMPWSVFFAQGGIAFHQGDLSTPSAGCVKLAEADARQWFGHLQVGDQVQIH
ncbi:L,D-transpeptidase [Pseudonocardia sp. ICBG1293]|uniref:L,D-transpeptidase n=1 Tax=Pseudonocardia sp. ICBG1293 TaxID=2844382 RepID=UPI001CCF7B31|nr:L,D-transpeptidase [Pseudonocardia sp. ICBG1293]